MPSGSLKPSKEDIDLTDRLYQCGLILNIPIHDHMILNMTTFITFKALELMAKIEKSLKYKPNFKVVAEMKEEAEKIRKQAYKEGLAKGLNKGKKEGIIEGEATGFYKGLTEGEIIGFDKGEVAGIDKGKDIGKLEEKINIAREMLKINPNDVVMIHKITKLSMEDIENIRGQSKK